MGEVYHTASGFSVNDDQARRVSSGVGSAFLLLDPLVEPHGHELMVLHMYARFGI